MEGGVVLPWDAGATPRRWLQTARAVVLDDGDVAAGVGDARGAPAWGFAVASIVIAWVSGSAWIILALWWQAHTAAARFGAEGLVATYLGLRAGSIITTMLVSASLRTLVTIPLLVGLSRGLVRPLGWRPATRIALIATAYLAWLTVPVIGWTALFTGPRFLVRAMRIEPDGAAWVCGGALYAGWLGAAWLASATVDGTVGPYVSAWGLHLFTM
jgi:hypothetical protein